jgi:ABC-2 type transport system ATP-binding protein
VGYLPELNPLYGEMMVYDLLEFTAQIRDIQGAEFRRSLDRVVDLCGLQRVIHREIRACSKGYKQRIGLATAMLHDPDILILDEPTVGLDPNQIVEIRELIKGLGKEKTLIISSHILQEIEATVDRMIIIHDGSIVANGTSGELMAGLRGVTQLTLEVKLAGDESVAAMNTRFPDVTLTNDSVTGESRILTLEYDRTMDPREDVFNYAKQSGWVILEMTHSRVQLEEVFRNLTSEGVVHA